jgi:hypothetical protein
MSSMFIISEKNRGLFIGNYNGIAIFSSNDGFLTSRICGFEDKEAALEFVKNNMYQIENTVEYLEIPSEGFMYVTMIDIIKAGYSDYVEDIFMNMHASPTLH